MLFTVAEKLTTNSMDTTLNKIDCIFAVNAGMVTYYNILMNLIDIYCGYTQIHDTYIHVYKFFI